MTAAIPILRVYHKSQNHYLQFGLIAQLVEPCTGIAEVMCSNPVSFRIKNSLKKTTKSSSLQNMFRQRLLSSLVSNNVQSVGN